MFHNRFTIGFCCMAMHKEPVKPVLDNFVRKIEERNDCLLLIYHCFDDMLYDVSDTGKAVSVFDAVSYDAIDVMIVFEGEERQHETFVKICQRCREHSVPVIAIDVPFDDSFFVSFGYGEAFGKIVEHVLEEHKCKKIKHIAGIRGNDFTQTRIDCCAEVMARHGLTLEENDILYGGFWEGPTSEVMDEFFASGEEIPDAFICANDAMAMTVCHKLAEKGYKIPEDVIVTGFDGIEFEKYHSPRLTTAVRDNNELSDALLKIIDDIKSDPSVKPYNIELSYTPVFSESCGCIRHSSVESRGIVTEIVKNYSYVRGHEERMNRMSNEIALNPSVEQALEILREYSFIGTYLCVTEEFAECLKTGNLPIEEQQTATYPRAMKLLLACVDENMRNCEGETFSTDMILPDIENRIPGNYTFVISSLYSQQLSIGYFISYYVYLDIYFDQLYTYSMALNRCLETIRVHEHMKGLNRKMEFMFTHDQLTKIYNRYGFYKNFTDAFETCKGKEIFIASVDLNDMKYINDNFGHSEGDEALRITANSLLIAASNTAENIICSRFGGDEFVVAMICESSAEEKAELFRRNFIAAVDAFNEKNEKGYKVSASIGISCASLCDIKNIEELIERADRMMYTDKARHKRRPKGI